LFLIQINRHTIDIKPNNWTFFSLGIGLSLSVSLFSEGFKTLYRIGLNLLAVIALLLSCYLLPDKFYPVHIFQVISIGIVIILSAFFVPFFKKENDIPFWEFSKSSILELIISGVFSMVLYAGVSLAIFSLKELFKIDIHREVYQDISVICFVLFAPVYFLANITDKTQLFVQEYKFDKFIKILGLYILAPILALYTLILYVYLVQIIVKWQLPNGYVSTLVSILGLGGFLSMLILYPLRQENNKITVLLSKYFPVLLMPLLILMSVGIFRRLGDYGMTINRLYVLILNIWLYGICIYLIISKSNHLKWIVISFTAVLLISSVGPWSVYHITKRTMIKEIAQLLSESRLLKDGKVIDNQDKSIDLDPKVSEQLSEDLKYISNNYGIEKLQQFFTHSLKNETLSDMNNQLGIDNMVILNENYYNAWIDKKNNTNIDIKNYQSMLLLPTFDSDNSGILNNDQLEISMTNLNILIKPKSNKSQAFNIPLKPKLKMILEAHKKNNSYTTEEMTIDTENCKLIINSVSGDYFPKNDSISISDCDAQLFLK